MQFIGQVETRGHDVVILKSRHLLFIATSFTMIIYNSGQTEETSHFRRVRQTRWPAYDSAPMKLLSDSERSATHLAAAVEPQTFEWPRGPVGAADPLGRPLSKCATSEFHGADEITQRAPGWKTVKIVLQALLQICVLCSSATEGSWICAAAAERGPSEPTPCLYTSSKCDFQILWLGSLVMDVFVLHCFVTRHILHWWIVQNWRASHGGKGGGGFGLQLIIIIFILDRLIVLGLYHVKINLAGEKLFPSQDMKIVSIPCSLMTCYLAWQLTKMLQILGASEFCFWN